MLAHLLGVLALIGSALLLVFGLGVTVFGLARGDRRLARRAALGAAGLVVVYLLGVALSAALAPSRVLPFGEELSFCGFDCHLHVSIAQVGMDEDFVGLVVKARSDAKGEPEHPSHLRFRLVGRSGEALVPYQEGKTFPNPLEAGQSTLDTIGFLAKSDDFPYTLRVTYPDLPEALLLGPANSRAVGKTTLSLGE